MTRLLTIDYYFFVTLLLFLPYHVMAQVEQSGLTWNPGTVLLEDSTTLNGFVQNNEKFRLIKFKSKLSDVEEISFQEKRIVSMEYFDSTLSRNRKFYTLDVQDEESVFQGPVLFEVIMVMKEFVVLSRKFGVIPDDKSKKRDTDVSKIEFDQVEKIFLVGEDSKAELLLLSVLTDSTKSYRQDLPVKPFFDPEVLQKYTSDRWSEVKQYIKVKKLNPKRRPDLIKILDYYQKLEEEK